MPFLHIPVQQLKAEERLAAKQAAMRLSEGEALMSLPDSLTRILVEVLSNIADGEMTKEKAQFTTTQAAAFLNVSRPYFVSLLKEGRIPFHKVGSHRRVYVEDIKVYKKQQDEQAFVALTELQEQAQEMSMGY